jgi:hypothetical protein
MEGMGFEPILCIHGFIRFIQLEQKLKLINQSLIVNVFVKEYNNFKGNEDKKKFQNYNMDMDML